MRVGKGICKTGHWCSPCRVAGIGNVQRTVWLVIQTKCGFDNLPNGRAGADLLVTLGPTLFVDIGFDPILDFIQYGRFAGVDLAAGGQVHKALIGRTFL